MTDEYIKKNIVVNMEGLTVCDLQTGEFNDAFSDEFKVYLKEYLENGSYDEKKEDRYPIELIAYPDCRLDKCKYVNEELVRRRWNDNVSFDIIDLWKLCHLNADGDFFMSAAITVKNGKSLLELEKRGVDITELPLEIFGLVALASEYGLDIREHITNDMSDEDFQKLKKQVQKKNPKRIFNSEYVASMAEYLGI